MSIKSVLRKAREASLIEDAVEYAIFPDPGHFEVAEKLPGPPSSKNPNFKDQAGCYEAGDIVNGLRLLQVACLDVVRETVKDFQWHVDPFQLFLPLQIEINGRSRGRICRDPVGAAAGGNTRQGKVEGGSESDTEEDSNQLPWIWRPDRAEEDDDGDEEEDEEEEEEEDVEEDEGEDEDSQSLGTRSSSHKNAHMGGKQPHPRHRRCRTRVGRNATSSKGATHREGGRNDEASVHVPPHLYGRTRYGACIDDEWLVVWLLLEVSRKLPHVSIGEWRDCTVFSALTDVLRPQCSVGNVLLLQLDVDSTLWSPSGQ